MSTTLLTNASNYWIKSKHKMIEIAKCDTNVVYCQNHSFSKSNSVDKKNSNKRIININDLENILQEYENNSESSNCYYSYFYYLTSDDAVIVLPKIIIKAKENHINNIIQEYNDIISLENTRNGIYYFDCDCTTGDQVLDIVTAISQKYDVEWCWPDMYVNIKMCNPLYSQQYYLKNTGQNGGVANIDINVEPVWQITKGDSSIVVSVIDSGVDRNHEDLIGRLTSFGYTCGDVTGDGSPKNTVSGNMSSCKGHGTACAGIIAANDNTIGIKGVAPNVKILPVNIYPYNVYNNPSGQATLSEIASAIAWAAERSDIINISLAIDDTIDEIEDAINDAVSSGRNGKGCVVVASAGNDNPFKTVLFPANMNNVIAVGAVDKNGTIWYYSCKGSSLDLVAPSGNLGMNGDVVTTDMMGSDGYNVTGNYINSFGGTSAAAPQVAGVAALMLSVNPNLTASSVKSILDSTATSLGVFNSYGYGLVNAEAAVQRVIQSMTTPMHISGPVVLHDTAVYEVSGLSPNMRVRWSFAGSYQCIEDYPEYNKCTLVRGTNNHSTGPILADVYLDSVRIKHLYMSLRPFSASYYQEACAYHGVGHPAIPSQTLTPDIAHFVHQGCLVHLASDFFTGQNVTYSGVTPETWSFNGTHQVIFSLPLGSGGIPFQVTLNPNGTSYEKRFLFFSIGNNGNSTSSLNIEVLSGSEFLITVSGDGRLYQSENNKNGIIDVDSWIIEAYNMNNGTKAFGQQIQGNSFILNTSDWQAGNYIIRAVVDGDVLTEKIQVVR